MNTTEQALLGRLASSLRGERTDGPVPADVREEAIRQSVYPLIAPDNDPVFLSITARNARNRHEHRELHRLMTESGIPYAILKGCASAAWYPNPNLRTLGDVDFIVGPEDWQKACGVLVQHGFTQEKDKGGIHVAFHRPPHTVWEMHRSVNGADARTAGFLAQIMEDAREYGGMRLPSPFHHCLVLLCHTASHLTAQGIGLRHLCDWAVFVNRTDVSRWQRELRQCGLWCFAQVLTQTAVRYLDLPEQPGAGAAEDALTAAMMEDILRAGSFGNKDADRYRQIKYIANRGMNTVDRRPVLLQLKHTIDRKAKTQGRSRAAVIASYAGMLISGRRKPDTITTVRMASKRKRLYSALRLFKPEEET